MLIYIFSFLCILFPFVIEKFKFVNEKVKDLGYKCLQGSFNSVILDIHWLLIDVMIALEYVAIGQIHTTDE